jgi:hypothetical protein
MDGNTVSTDCDASTGGFGSNGFSGGLTVSALGSKPDFLPPSAVPLPAALPLLGAGLLGLVAVGRRRNPA